MAETESVDDYLESSGRSLRAPLAGALALGLGAVLLLVNPWAGHPAPRPAPAASIAPSAIAAVPSGRPVRVSGSCGHGAACPSGSGLFVTRLGPGPAHASRRLVVTYVIPTGWALWEVMGGGFRIGDDRLVGDMTLLGVFWPVRSLHGRGDAHASATAMAALPGATSREPKRVSVGGRVGWRVTFTGTAGTSSTCVIPTEGLFVGEGGAHFCLPVVRAAGRDLSGTPVGVNGSQPVEVTLVDVPGGRPGAPGSILGIWNPAVDADDEDGRRAQALIDSMRTTAPR